MAAAATAIKYPRYAPAVVTETAGLTEEEWMEFRRGGIGGSDVAIVMGMSPYTTTRDLYYDKLGIKPVVDIEDNWVAKEIGHLLEPLVAKIFAQKTGLRPIQIKKMFRHPHHPFMYADVDYFVETSDGKRGILEIKTSHYNNRSKWAGDAIPYHYELQVRHYMSVMDLDFAYIACLFSNSEADFLYRRLDRDRVFEQSIIDAEQFFWEEYVQAKAEPPYTESGDMILESIRRHVGAADKSKSAMMLNAGEIELINRYLSLKEEKSALEAKAKELDNAMKRHYAPIVDRMGKACEATADKDGKLYIVKFNPQYRTKISKDNLEKLKISDPDIYDRYVETTETRSFRVDIKSVIL